MTDDGPRPGPGWYSRTEDGSVAWWDGSQWTAPAQPEHPGPPPAQAMQPVPGWYPTPDPAVERWWDGHRWTDDVRPAPARPHPPATGVDRATEVIRLERIRWAGVSWGSGPSGLSVAFGVVFVVMAMPIVLFALSARYWIMGVLMAVMAVTFLFGAAAFFVNAHFCRELERRRTTAPSPSSYR
ncbi:DUF2510 domain-containing protein [Cellulomonas composti]|uniref:DUF2510 domain-containing protein n=1 Tax=Cellulomonas composti TaxID=266130 RepID=A0A511J7V7_9CELL|nr:DUF2510 domain-containing protein [Cellulomonas composti]GEL94086.1 hypothetical protein CCO02nite_07440 [Cellulomonas composti]